jgi:hypothetical protein
VSIGGALAAPADVAPPGATLRLVGIALSACCLLVSVALLFRQGLFRPAAPRRGAAGGEGRGRG